MRGFVRLCALALAMCGAAASSASAAAPPEAPLGAWRTTNDCFLAAFILSEGGRTLTAYMSGEKDDKAAWSWDGATLTIMSPTFDKDSFKGRLAGEHLEVDYVWHDLDKDELHKQACAFERFSPFGL